MKRPSAMSVPTLALALLAAWWPIAATPPSLRADELSSKLEKMLDGLRPIFEDEHETSVTVGDVTADPTLVASGGPAIANAMIDAFGKLGLKVSRKARLAIEGRYRLSEEPASKLRSLRIDLKLTDRVAGRTLTDVFINVVDAATIVRLAGGTGDISGTRREQSEKVEKALKDPTTRIESDPGSQVARTRISAGPGSPYAIEVLVKAAAKDYRPRAVELNEDQAFVGFRPGEVYAIRLINDSDSAAGVDLAIDGLSIFAFSDATSDRSNRLVLGPKSRGDIIGWYRNGGPGGSSEFLVSRAAEAAAAKEVPTSSARIGMITATFAAAWPSSQPPPTGEEQDTGRGELGTALGARTDQSFTPVNFQIGKPKAAITVRYDRPSEPADLPAK
ncbi:hypothetical protein [Aquisphaera insulae]|uniref:hypothetical protein n=1 Tax=Aquisphaera insulae TaxID=2712864 RepID=UPI0013EDD184|nr:hypothetical protein [Aquisphaera insulae]